MPFYKDHPFFFCGSISDISSRTCIFTTSVLQKRPHVPRALQHLIGVVYMMRLGLWRPGSLIVHKWSKFWCPKKEPRRWWKSWFFFSLKRCFWWFQIFFIFTPFWGRFPIWLIFFRWVETTNQCFWWFEQQFFCWFFFDSLSRKCGLAKHCSNLRTCTYFLELGSWKKDTRLVRELSSLFHPQQQARVWLSSWLFFPDSTTGFITILHHHLGNMFFYMFFPTTKQANLRKASFEGPNSGSS